MCTCYWKSAGAHTGKKGKSSDKRSATVELPTFPSSSMLIPAEQHEPLVTSQHQLTSLNNHDARQTFDDAVPENLLTDKAAPNVS